MKKLFSAVSIVAIVLLLPIVVWVVKDSPFEKTLVLDNRVDGAPAKDGAQYFFDYLKADPTLTSLEKTNYSIDEAKTFDAVYVATQDGFRTTNEQWNQVKMNIDQNDPSLLVAEYGVIHNTESGELSQLISQDLGVESTNWSGLYVADLGMPNNLSIPDQVINNIDGAWNYSGPGLVFNNSNENTAFVIELGDDAKGVSLATTDQGQAAGYDDLSARYENWFDVIIPDETTTSLYNFDIGLSDDNRRILAEHNLPDVFPAVTVHGAGASNRVYFAGRFSASDAVPEIYQVQGLSRVYGAIERFSDNSFYWNSFFPIMQKVAKWHEENSEQYSAAAQTATLGASQISYPARMSATEERIEVLRDGEFAPLTIKGVNIGMANPGHFPGEAAITLEEYTAWFEAIGEMNANTVRVYTLHPPEFYQALAHYNAQHDDKIYVLHGVWINEEWITGDADAFHTEAVEGFHREIRYVVDALHGNALVPHVPGHASGVYVTDVSDYVIGWVLGTEWDPFMVNGTNEKHPDVGQFDGTYYRTEDAAPFEFWLASQMEYTTEYEIREYSEVRPMSFTNWVTTDILTHPSDSSEQEDIAEVDPNKIHVKGIMEDVGQFASYHIYPYYPDSLQRDQKYVTATDWRGEPNTYYAYLQELKSVHSMPVLVAEFGIPASRGRTHTGPNGMHQGGVTEEDQGKYVQRMMEDILHADYMGGLVFTWQDEWFKRTWNTMDFDNPNRRPMWSNPQTSEQQFGLLSYDRHKIKVDGDASEWTTEPFYEAASAEDSILAAHIDHDEGYLYARIDFAEDRDESGYPVILFDTIGDQGNTTVGGMGLSSENGTDFLATFQPGEERLMVDTYYDLHSYLYGWVYGFTDTPATLNVKNSGVFQPIDYVLNQALYNPETGETTPFEEYETGRLREGNANPESADYDSLADFAWSEDGRTLELRIPWLLLNFRDPSQKEITTDIIAAESIYDSEFIQDIGIGFAYVSGDGADQALGQFKRYGWQNWDVPESQPRLKQSYYVLQDYFATID